MSLKLKKLLRQETNFPLKKFKTSSSANCDVGLISTHPLSLYKVVGLVPTIKLSQGTPELISDKSGRGWG